MLDAVRSIGCNDVMAHDAATTVVAHMDRHLNILLVLRNNQIVQISIRFGDANEWLYIKWMAFYLFRGFVAAVDFVSSDGMVAENMAAGSQTVMLDDVCLGINFCEFEFVVRMF